MKVTTRISRFRPSRTTAVAVAALVVATGGIAFATIPASDGVIHACFLKSGGTLRVIDSATGKCKSTEQSLSWNQRGIPGAPGGLSGYQRVSERFANTQRGVARCPEGKMAVGGGYSVTLPTSTPGLRKSLSGQDGNGIQLWLVEFDEPVEDFAVEVICANGSE